MKITNHVKKTKDIKQIINLLSNLIRDEIQDKVISITQHKMKDERWKKNRKAHSNHVN